MASIFSKIVAGEIPCYKVAEDDHHLAFLDIQPLRMGHVLVIPKKEEDYIFDLPEIELAQLMAFAQKVAKALKQVIPCKKIGVSVVGLEVPHVHIHLLPMNEVSDMDFSQPKKNFPTEEMQTVAQKIASKVID